MLSCLYFTLDRTGASSEGFVDRNGHSGDVLLGSLEQQIDSHQNTTIPTVPTAPTAPTFVIYAGSATLPKAQSLRCNPAVRPILHNYGRKALTLVKEAKCLRCPWGKSEFAHCVDPMEVQKQGHQIYVKYADSPVTRTSALEKIGYSSQLPSRYPDMSTVHPIVRMESLPQALCDRLSENYLSMVNEIIDTESTPFELRTLLTIIRDRGASRLGFKKTGQSLTVEAGAAVEFGCGNIGEQFMCDTRVIGGRRDEVGRILQAVLHIFDPLVGCQILQVLSWKTGAKAGRLSSEICAAEYIFRLWENALVDAAEPGATTSQGIFSRNYSPKQCAEAHHVVVSRIELVIELRGLLLLDRNETILFPNRGLEKLLISYHFQVVAYIFGNEVIIFRHLHVRAVVLLVRPYCRAGDSQAYVDMRASMLRCMAIDFLASIVAYVERKPPTAHEAGKLNAITAGAVFEMATLGFHLNKQVSVTTLRDILLTDRSSTMACVQNGLSKTPDDWYYPDSRAARRDYQVQKGANTKKLCLKDPNVNRPVDSFIQLQAQNILSFSTTSSLPSDYAIIDTLFKMGTKGDKEATKGRYEKCWETLLKGGKINGELLHAITALRPKKQNKGRSGPRPRRHFSKQDTDAEWERIKAHQGKFWVREKTEYTQIPQSGTVFMALSFDSIKTRCKKEGVTVHINRVKPSTKFGGFVEAVLVWGDDQK